jgi:hypothetical protein
MNDDMFVKVASRWNIVSATASAQDEKEQRQRNGNQQKHPSLHIGSPRL